MEWVNARTVSHLRMPVFGAAGEEDEDESPVPPPSNGTVRGGARLAQLTSFFSRGTTDHSRWWTELSDVVEMFSRLRVISARL